MSTLAPPGTRLTTQDEAVRNAQGNRTVIVVPPKGANNIPLANGSGALVRPAYPEIHILGKDQPTTDIFTGGQKKEATPESNQGFDLGSLIQQLITGVTGKTQSGS